MIAGYLLPLGKTEIKQNVLKCLSFYYHLQSIQMSQCHSGSGCSKDQENYD